ncbi:MAG: TetR/AcrR family transcriptional regulator, partial [Pseudobdellovibrionaceae bacterium]
ALIKAALASISKTGEVQFSLRELAESVGVSHPAAYRHFSSKREILFEIAKDGFLRLGLEFEKILAKNPEDIVSLGVKYVHFAINNPDHFKVMFHPDLKTEKNDLEALAVGRKTFEHLHNCVLANQKNKKFPKVKSEYVSITAWSTVHGLAVLMVNENIHPEMGVNKKDFEALATIVANQLMAGLMARA